MDERKLRPQIAAQRSIEELVHEARTSDAQYGPNLTSSIGSFIFASPEKVLFLKGFFSGRPVVDLGSGEHAHMESLAKKLGAVSYKGVDKYISFESGSARKVDEDGFVSERLKEDMLAYVSSLSPESTNVIMNAIGQHNVDIDQAVNREYIEALIRAIAQVVPRGGIVMGQLSPFLRILKRHGFLQVYFPDFTPAKHEDLEFLMFTKPK